MEILFIVLALVCQVILLSHSEIFLGELEMIEVFGVKFTGRGLIFLTIAFLILAAVFGWIKGTKAHTAKQEVKRLKDENEKLIAEKHRLEREHAREKVAQRS